MKDVIISLVLGTLMVGILVVGGAWDEPRTTTTTSTTTTTEPPRWNSIKEFCLKDPCNCPTAISPSIGFLIYNTTKGCAYSCALEEEFCWINNTWVKK